jgi:AraC family transcriptional regulator
MDYSIQLKELPAQMALCTEARATFASIGASISAAFGDIMRAAGEGEPPFAGRPFVIYPEDVDGQFVMRVCLPVVAHCPPPPAGSDVTLDEVPGATAACLVHKGPYSELAKAYDVLRTWLTANGRKTTGGPREIYVTDPGSVPAAELVTEIAWPVA